MLTYQIEKIKKERKEGKKSGKGKVSLYDLDLMNLAVSVLNRHMGNYKNPYIPFTGAGVPGFKLFADASGAFHICERTYGDASIIGDVKSGLDYDRILRILRSLRSETAACESCVAKNMCSLCYVTFASGPAIERDPGACEEVQVQLEETLSHLWSIAEIDENILLELAEEYYALFEDIGKELL
jgi:radical SAM protein with 4Fe4S-binding SPASM domain